MQNKSWYDTFLEKLYEKFPKRAQLTDELINLLLLEREAVYRRLRREVLFTVFEIATIAREWNISIDDILHHNYDGYPSFRLQQFKCINSTERDFKMMQEYVDLLTNLKDDPNAEYIEVCNLLPMVFFSTFPQLAKLYTFIWMCRYGGDSDNCSYSQIVFPEKLMELERAHFQAISNISNVYFIMDEQIIDYLINEIEYYNSIYLLTSEEITLIKENLHAFLNYLENILRKGHFPETKNKVHLYISQTNVDTSYACYSSKKIKGCKMRSFLMNITYSQDARLFNDEHHWLHLKKRSSIQISGVDERRRINFFRVQRQLVDNLSVT